MQWHAEWTNSDALPIVQPAVPPAESALDFVRNRLGFYPDPNQEKIFDPSIHRGLLCCTRQFGKSTCIAALAVHRAYTIPESTILVIARVKPQSADFIYRAQRFLTRLGIRPRRDPAHEFSLLLPNGSRILGLAEIDDTVRGYTANLIVIEEAARVKDAAIDAIIPSLATTAGDIWMISTPDGRQGAFYREWSGRNDWFRLRITADDCPRIPRQHLERERNSKGERNFLQEYYCEFLSADNAVFDATLLDQALLSDLTRSDVAGQRSHYYVALDLGRLQDPTAIAILERCDITLRQIDYVTYQRQQVTDFTLHMLEIFPLQTNFSKIISRVRDLVSAYPYKNACTLVLDATGLGQPVHEMFRAANLGCPIIPITITAGENPSDHHVPKKDLISAVQLMLEMHELRIPRSLPGVPLLLEEMNSMRALPTQSGSLRYEAAPGCHDDLVIALALAIWPTRPRRPFVGQGTQRLI